MAKANRKLNIIAVTSVPEEDRKQALQRAEPVTPVRRSRSTTEEATRNSRAISTTTGAASTTGCSSTPASIPTPFWGLGWGWPITDVLLMDALLDDHWGGDYERGFEAGQDSATANAGYDNGQSTSYDSQQGDVGFDGSYQDSSSGGGDVDFTATTPAAVMTLVAISISAGSVGPILAGVGSTRAAAATPGSNVVDSCQAVVPPTHQIAWKATNLPVAITVPVRLGIAPSRRGDAGASCGTPG